MRRGRTHVHHVGSTRQPFVDHVVDVHAAGGQELRVLFTEDAFTQNAAGHECPFDDDVSTIAVCWNRCAGAHRWAEAPGQPSPRRVRPARSTLVPRPLVPAFGGGRFGGRRFGGGRFGGRRLGGFGRGRCRARLAGREDARDDAVGPAVGQIGRQRGQRQDGRASLTLFDETDLLARRLANPVIGLQPVDLGGQLTVHLLEFVEFGLPLGQVDVLVTPRSDRQDEDRRTEYRDDGQHAQTGEQCNLRSSGDPLVDGDRPGEVAETRAALVGRGLLGWPLDRRGL